MNDLVIRNESIENMIYVIRGKQVMLDRDLAKLYECVNGTKTVNQAVKRHDKRFPERFMFQLTEEEFNKLKSQNGTAKFNMVRTLPYAFTEQGVAMLATVLKTPVAEEISLQIMDAFVAMQKYISNSSIEQKYINELVFKNAEDIKLLKQSFQKNERKKKINEIYFDGQIYDAYSKILDIFNDAEYELIVVDGYTDKTFLDMIKKINCNVILITKKFSKISNLDIEKYNAQYNNLKVIYDESFHDRYFILDKKIVYHCGASINHAGQRTFGINILEDEMVKEIIINRVLKIII